MKKQLVHDTGIEPLVDAASRIAAAAMQGLMNHHIQTTTTLAKGSEIGAFGADIATAIFDKLVKHQYEMPERRDRTPAR
ncbi:MAG TPA: hypothetical protein VMH02_07860 [Verrucomicrobiae bacterium]|nr:hypothetical protein [Verrucomicrobiae bacterium]